MKVIRHEEAGWTVRRKGLDNFEGSVATVGFAVVGSSILVDE